MFNMYFRAWLKEENKMVTVESIYLKEQLIEPSIEYLDEIKYDEYSFNEIDLMLGMKINNKIVYVNDIVELEYDYEQDLPQKWLLDIADEYALLWLNEIISNKVITSEDDFRIVKNIYENEELL